MMKAPDSGWAKVVDLWEESIIVQTIITIFTITTLCLWFLVPLFRGDALDDLTVPGELMLVIGAVLGHWFRTKADVRARKAAQQASEGASV